MAKEYGQICRKFRELSDTEGIRERVLSHALPELTCAAMLALNGAPLIAQHTRASLTRASPGGDDG